MLEITGPPHDHTPVKADLPMLELYLNSNRHLIYVDIIMLTLLIMNIISTCSTEVERIWKGKQSATTLAFYFIRYIPPILVGLSIAGGVSYEVKYSGNACQALQWGQTTLTMAVLSLAEILMVVRVWALYRFDKRILVFLGLIILGEVAVGFWAAGTVVSSIRPIHWPREATPIPGCPLNVPNVVNTIRIVFAYNMVAVGIICLCMLNQCLARNSIEQPHLGTWRDMIGIRTAWPIVHVLIRDGCLYFLMVFCSNMFLFILMSVSEQVAFFTLTMAQAVHSIPATRLVLNLRERSHNNGPHDGRRANDITTDHMSDMNFAPRTSWDQNTLPLTFVPARDGDAYSRTEDVSWDRKNSSRSWSDVPEDSMTSKMSDRGDGLLDNPGMPSSSTNHLLYPRGGFV